MQSLDLILCNAATIWSQIIPNWLTAIGTIGAVLVALFYKPFLTWWNRPKIDIQYKDEPPFRDEIEDTSSSSTPVKRMVIHVCVTNSGKYTAEHAVLNIDEYYSKRADGSYVQKLFTPRRFKDCNNANLNVVAPQLKYYIDIALIQKYQEIISDGEKGQRKQNYKLYLLGEGKTEHLGKGTFVVPLKFYSSRTDSKIVYLSLFWDSDDYKFEKDCFEVKIISEKEFEKLPKIV